MCCTTSIPIQQPTEPLSSVPEIAFDEPSAAVYLELGFPQYEAGLWSDAIESFEGALSTGDLNDVGRVVSYWHIGDSYKNIGDSDKAAEAFFYFISIAQDLLEDKENYAGPEGFFEGFQLEAKLNYAARYVKIIWELKKAL